MVSTSSLLAFAAMCFVVIAIPGPSVLFVIGRALAHGRRAALATVLGNLLGSYALVVIVALGLGPLVQGSAHVLTAVQLAGAAYLSHLGVQAIRHRDRLRADMAVPAGRKRGDLRTVLDGLLVGVTNPKGLVFFAAVLPQFVHYDAGGIPAQMMILGLVPAAVGLCCDTLWGLGASAARSWFAASDRRLSAIGAAGGTALIGLGVLVALTSR
ncbi:LysE family translocator [Streptomyces camelliae]|uniref:LysE family translocator n=1 Tax=Streptomyces camelliae TaxID=3004093 RepID=A0ABY7PD86_9ACTN|nr:LysE family translocator [Streptomyces sp. HUAS 2-6]WBO68551.1 LysE family translocator [Streptomyces sp. HUAS 2-6]